MTYRFDRPWDIRQLEPVQRLRLACGNEYLGTCTDEGWRVFHSSKVGAKFEIYRSHKRRLSHRMVDRMEQAIAIDRLYRGPV